MEELREMIGEKKGRETNGLGWLEDGDHANGFRRDKGSNVACGGGQGWGCEWLTKKMKL